MQRRARELLVRVKSLREQSERLAAIDYRLEANRAASTYGEQTNTRAENITPSKPRSRPRRKRLSSAKKKKKESDKKPAVNRKAWGSGPGGEPVNTYKYKAKEWKPPTGTKNIELVVEPEVLRAKREYKKQPGYMQASEVEGEDSVWWYVGGKGVFPDRKPSVVQSNSRSKLEDEEVDDKVEETDGGNVFEIVGSEIHPKPAEEPNSETTDVVDQENSVPNKPNFSESNPSGTLRPNFKLHHSKREKVFLLQEFSQQWLALGLKNIAEKTKLIQDAIALRKKARILPRVFRQGRADTVIVNAMPT